LRRSSDRLRDQLRADFKAEIDRVISDQTPRRPRNTKSARGLGQPHPRSTSILS
jgi:hypothetical protein